MSDRPTTTTSTPTTRLALAMRTVPATTATTTCAGSAPMKGTSYHVVLEVTFAEVGYDD